MSDVEGVATVLEAVRTCPNAAAWALPLALGRLGRAEAIVGLVAALTHPSGHVRFAARDVLTSLEAGTDIAGVQTGLRGPSSGPRERAALVWALGWFRYRGHELAVAALRDALWDRDPMVRAAVLRSLGRLESAPTVDDLVRLLDADPPVRAEALALAYRAEDERATGTLLGLLAHPDPAVGGCAARSLAGVTEPRVVDALAARYSPEAQPEVRRIGARALAEQARRPDADASVFERLTSALSDPDGRLRLQVVSDLESVTDRRALAVVLTGWRDPDSDVRQAAVVALQSWRDPRAIEALFQACEDEADAVRSAAVAALGQLGDPRAVEPLIEALADRSGSVRSDAAAALGRLGDRRALEPLRRLLSDLNDPYEHRVVHRALQQLEEPAAKDQPCQRDDTEDMRRWRWSG